jgi:hypothetical protein
MSALYIAASHAHWATSLFVLSKLTSITAFTLTLPAFLSALQQNRQ